MESFVIHTSHNSFLLILPERSSYFLTISLNLPSQIGSVLYVYVYLLVFGINQTSRSLHGIAAFQLTHLIPTHHDHLVSEDTHSVLYIPYGSKKEFSYRSSIVCDELLNLSLRHIINVGRLYRLLFCFLFNLLFSLLFRFLLCFFCLLLSLLLRLRFLRLWLWSWGWLRSWRQHLYILFSYNLNVCLFKNLFIKLFLLTLLNVKCLCNLRILYGYLLPILTNRSGDGHWVAILITIDGGFIEQRTLLSKQNLLPVCGFYDVVVLAIWTFLLGDNTSSTAPFIV